MTLKKLLIQILFWYALSINAYAHEITGELSKIESFVKSHMLYHKATSYRRVDTLILKESNKQRLYSYYFDPAADLLYSCIGNPKATISRDDSAICSTDNAGRISWNDAEVAYGKRKNLSPIDRQINGPVYFFQGTTPMRQFTTWVYYSGRGTVIKCRDTLTTYNFEYNKDGDHLFFQNEKKDEWTQHCEQLYPQP